MFLVINKINFKSMTNIYLCHNCFFNFFPTILHTFLQLYIRILLLQMVIKHTQFINLILKLQESYKKCFTWFWYQSLKHVLPLSEISYDNCTCKMMYVYIYIYIYWYSQIHRIMELSVIDIEPWITHPTSISIVNN